jgi:peptidoglycan hydrolase-like protein with peptidoglycan-binding domain
VKYIQTILNGSALDGANSCLLSGTWQNGVIAKDTTTQIAVDGSYGPATTGRVTTFQKSHCISYDGWVGKQTWGKLCQEGSGAGYSLSGPGWYNKYDWKDVKLLAAYKASVWAGCNNNSWPYLFNY